MTTSPPPATELDRSLRTLEERLDDELAPDVSDSSYCIRIVGEFSAGKSRFLAEMIRERMSESLLPASQLAPETTLPLEVTDGESERLTVIERSTDFKTDVETLEVYDEFPTRRELENSPYNPQEHRLRLTLEAPELVWSSDPIDGEDGQPTRVYLVDMPGWNDSESAEVDFELGESPPAVIFVTAAHRLQSKAATERLMELAEELRFELPPGERLTLIPVVTHWEDSPKHRGVLSSVLDEIRSEFETIDDFQARLADPLCIDFEGEGASEKIDDLRQRFWALIDETDPPSSEQQEGFTVDGIVDVVEDWQLRESFEQTVQLLEQGEQLLDDLGEPADPFSSLNATKLAPSIEENSHVEKLRSELPRDLRKSTQGETSPHDIELPELSGDHPLKPWWSRHYVPTIEPAIESLNQLSRSLSALPERFQKKIGSMSRQLGQDEDLVWQLKDEFDISRWARGHIEEHASRAEESLLKARLLFPPELRTAVREGASQASILATLISIQCGQTTLLEIGNIAAGGITNRF